MAPAGEPTGRAPDDGPVPTFVPMKAVAGELPPDDGRWAFELKWDGMRAVVRCDRELAVASGRGRDVTASFPELAGLAAQLAGHRAVLDGEIVATDAGGVPSFGLLQKRMNVASPAQVAARAAEVPVQLVLFDLLWLDGLDATAVPYDDRRRLLEGLVEPGTHWCVGDRHLGDGSLWLEAVAAQGLEGLVAKRRDSRYEPGRRSSAWRKIKVRRRQELVVGGWVAGERGLSGELGALLVGYHDPDRPLRPLVFAGRVGSGLGDAERRRWRERLEGAAVDDSPFEAPPPVPTDKSPRFARPEWVVEVAFGEWTADGVLRHPTYLGERFDKDPADVVREPEPGGA